jgi:hypothetical protein
VHPGLFARRPRKNHLPPHDNPYISGNVR